MLILLLIVVTVVVSSLLIYGKHKLGVQRKQIKNLESIKQDLQQALATLQEKMRHSMEDSLTHLPSWQVVEDRLNQHLLESQRYRLTMAILFVDINDFKAMNETFGHDVGDEILIEVGKRLQKSLRKGDSVSRYIKDVYVILLPRLNKPESAAIVVQRIFEALSAGVQIKDHTLTISTTIGVAVYPVDGQNGTSLLRHADQALQLAKEEHQACRFYHHKLHVDTQREFLLTSGLKNQNWLNELVIDYQPVIHSKDKTVFCLTALLAWQHKTLGLIHSTEFLEVAEKQGKVNQLTLWLLEKTGLEKRSAGLSSIPVSIQQLQNSQFIFEMSKILQACQFDPALLLLEIRNTAEMIPWEGMEKAINMLKYLHIKLAVSDFGPHVFSMSQLKNLSLDYLLIDNAVIQDAEYNLATQAFIKAMLDLVRSLSMQIIIKNVASQRQMEVLQRLGCYLIQGECVSQFTQKEIVEKI